MSRSGYSEEGDLATLNLYRASVERSLAGKRGQRFLRELVEALDALPEKKLVAGDFVKEGASCALGAVALKRGMDAAQIADLQRRAEEAAEDEWEDRLPDVMAEDFGIARSMAAEIMWMNDECGLYWDDKAADADERRWSRMRKWALDHLKPENREGLEP